MKRLLAATLAFLSISTSAHASLGRDDQWTYVPATSEHEARAELRSDRPEGVPSRLLFQIECDSGGQALLFRYFFDEMPVPVEPIELLISLDGTPIHDDIAFRMPTERGRVSTLEGRLALNGEIAAAVSDARYIMIYAPSDGGEPWHAGQAPALRRLVRECMGRPVS